MTFLLLLRRVTYRFGILLYGLLLRVMAPFHAKARLWVTGRRHWEGRLREATAGEASWIWFHCALLGEFEQGRNLLERLRGSYPQHKVLLTFFSPSGYEVRKTYAQADYVGYLPLDRPGAARRFVEAVQPALTVFVKYELWLEVLGELRRRGLPALLVSARMGPESRFLRGWLAPLYREALAGLAQVFTQDEATARLLRARGLTNVKQSADTRYDRVAANRASFAPLPEIEAFKGESLCLVAGSTWPRDEQLLFEAYEALAAKHACCLILAPHEIDSTRIQSWIDRYPAVSLRYSARERLGPQHRILWIDNIGMLSRLYHYADVAYVGGAWGSGLHNILEAAVFGPPVIFGPEYRKYPEAGDLIEAGGGFSVGSNPAAIGLIDGFFADPARRQAIREANEAFISRQQGATEEIFHWIQTHLPTGFV